MKSFQEIQSIFPENLSDISLALSPKNPTVKSNPTKFLFQKIEMTHGCKLGSIAAEFHQQAETQRLVDLEISSHKFQIRLDTTDSRCDSFEILAYRGFFDFSRDSIQLLRTLTLLLHKKLALT